ncbi:MAG: hypothetical protein JO034_13005 [Singulisphaera sp.]|nr:hypothetical protein [Singulisphaera sp.]
MPRQFRLETSDGWTVVTFSAAEVVPETKDPLHGRVEDEGHWRLLLDLSSVRSRSSNASGNLVRLEKKVDAAVGRWRPGGLEPDLHEPPRIMVLDRIFETYESGGDAFQGL